MKFMMLKVSTWFLDKDGSVNKVHNDKNAFCFLR